MIDVILWAYAALIVVGIAAQFYLVDRPREPVTIGGAIASAIVGGLGLYAILVTLLS